MENIIESIEHEKYVINIYQDDNPMNPREWDNLGTMVCFHPRYDLGDKKYGFYDADELLEYLKENKAIQLPLYLYDHSGISISTNRNYPFNNVWDSGQVGIIFVTYEQIKKEWGWKYITKERINKVINCLVNEVNVYDDYLRGNVYGYIVNCKYCGESIDLYWGFYGSNWKENGLLDQAYTKCDCEFSQQLAFPELSIDYISEEA